MSERDGFEHHTSLLRVWNVMVSVVFIKCVDICFQSGVRLFI